MSKKENSKQIHVSYYTGATDLKEARYLFQVASRRLLDPSKWYYYAGSSGAIFQLFDPKGNKSAEAAKRGDYIRVDIPGPGSSEGNGYDWVEIIDMEEQTEEAKEKELKAMVVHPCANPFEEQTTTAHFFTAEASSSFFIERRGLRVYASYLGRNEKLNNATGDLKENIRNTIVGLGAKAGFSKFQWTALMKGLLQV